MSDKHTILIAGATGLVGNCFFRMAEEDSYYKRVLLLTRRNISGAADAQEKVEQFIVDFDHLDKTELPEQPGTVVCTLGTTLKKAASKEKLVVVDYHYSMNTARFARKNGAENIILISSIGASSDSSSHYLQTKGMLERDIRQLGFKFCHILRPSLILGDREEHRSGEAYARRIMVKTAFLMPYRFRPIEAQILAEKIDYLAKNPKEGFHIYTGKNLY